MPDEWDRAAAGGESERQATAGEQLRAERQRQGLSLHEIAEDLRLDLWVLEALERDDYDALGAPVFAKGHLRKYAGLLGLPTDELLVSYYQMRSRPEGPPPPATGTLIREGERQPPGWKKPAAIAGAVLLAAIGVVLWIRHSPPAVEESGLEQVPLPVVAEPTPEPPQPLPPQPATEPAAGVGESMAGRPEQEQEQEQGPEPEPEPEPEADTEPVEVSAPAAVPEPEPVSAIGDLPQVELRLIFAANSWVEVYDAAENRLLFDEGRADSTRVVRGTAPLRVFLGFAPAVTVEVDGRAYDTPAPRSNGTVRFVIDSP